MNPHDLVYNALAKGATSSVEVGRVAGVRQKTANDIINRDLDLYKMLVSNKHDAKLRKVKRTLKIYDETMKATRSRVESERASGIKSRQIYEYRRYLRETGQTC